MDTLVACQLRLLCITLSCVADFAICSVQEVKTIKVEFKHQFLKVTLPNIKWGLLYGVILCNARAMGEFGAVSVVSGHIQGMTNTMPLQVEILYNEYNFVAAFAVSTLLAILALLTLVLKYILEWKVQRKIKKLDNEE